MKNIAIIVLSVALAAAIISGLFLYGRFHNTRDELVISKKKISELNERATELNQENSTLQDQIRRNAEGLEELKRARARISELEKRIQSSQSHIRYLEEEISREEKEIQGLHRELSALKAASATAESKMAHVKSSYEAEISELEEGLQGSQSRIRSLERQIAKEEDRSERLQRQLSDLKGAKAQVESKIDQLKTTYEALISDLKQQIEKKEVAIKSFEEKISVTFVDRILFEFGEATISPEGEGILKKVGEILKGVQGRQIRVVGHTDNIPILPEYKYKFPSNWELSAARAAAVVREFQGSIGLNPKNLEAVGRSLYEPIASNDTDEGRAQNRRVEIIIAPKVD